MPTQNDENVCPGVDLICPGCHRPLKLPRIGGGEGKPLVCGGCGQRFDCADLGAAPERRDPA